MISWYLRRFKAVRKSRVNFVNPRLETFEDRVNPSPNFTASPAFDSNLSNPNALEWPTRVGDFNGDGKQDFISFGGFGTTDIVSYFGNGDGTFTFKAKTAFAGFAEPRSESLCIGDFTSPLGGGPDGLDDFAYIDRGNSPNFFVDVWASKGDGKFALAGSSLTTFTRLSMAAGDLNKDGADDLVLGRFGFGGPNGTAGEYEVLINNGTGGFTAFERTATNNMDWLDDQPTIVDMNNDGNLDFVANNAFAVSGFGRGGVYYGDGLGNFNGNSVLNTPTTGGVDDHVVGDFDGNGLKDVALVVGKDFYLYFQTAPGTFNTAPTSFFTASDSPNDVAAADFDFDGRDDIAIAPFNATDANVRIYVGLANQTIDSGGGAAFATAGENISLAIIDGDFNGTPDLLVSDRITSPSSNKFQYLDNTNIPVGPLVSKVSVSALPNPVTYGKAVDFTAKVATFGNIATGDITFSVDGITIGTAPLDGAGSAKLTTVGGPFAVGNHSYSVSYAGDGTYLPNVSPTGTFTVNALATTVTSATIDAFIDPTPGNPAQGLYGGDVTYTVTMDISSGFAPTGSFDIFAGSLFLGKANVDASGKASLFTTLTPVGLSTVTAVYLNDPLYTTGEVKTFPDQIEIFQLGTVTNVVTSSNPSVFGEPISYTVEVDPDAVSSFFVTNPTFSGTVALLDNDNVIAILNLDAAGKAVYVVPPDYALGTHTIQAVYPGTPNIIGSSSTPFDQIVNKANSAVLLTADNTTITFGHSVTLTSEVSILAPGVGTPSGDVQFFQGGALIATVPVGLDGKASTTVSGLAAGSFTFNSIYGGNPSVAGSNSADVVVTVNPTVSTTTLSITPTSSSLGSPIRLDATVVNGEGIPVDVGTVTYSGTFNGQPLSDFVNPALLVVPVSGGLATTFLFNMPFGSGTITASYTGDASITNSADGPDTFDVTKAVPGLQLKTSSASGVPLGTSATFNVALSSPPGVPLTITGTVDFFDNGVLFATVPVAAGTASTSRVMTLGDHAITAKYSGDANYAGVTSGALNFNVFRPTDRFSAGAGAGGPDRVTVFDAAGNKIFSPLFAFSPDYTAGVRVATADFDGDGVQDVVMGTGPGTGSRVRILSGNGGTPIADFSPFGEGFTGGVFLAAGDVNGDFKMDLVVTPDQRGGARIRVFDNAALVTNSMIFPLSIASRADFIGIIDGTGRPDTEFRGGARAAVGDINGDGYGDIVMAAGTGGGPRIATFDGKLLTVTGGPKLFGDFLAFESKLRNGTFVAVGDVNGDGFAEIAAGAGPGGGPRVSIFDGNQLMAGNHVRTADFFAGDTGSRTGSPVALRYLDNDEKLDLLVGQGNGGDTIVAYAGSTLSGAFTAPPTILDFDAFALSPNSADEVRGVFVG